MLQRSINIGNSWIWSRSWTKSWTVCHFESESFSYSWIWKQSLSKSWLEVPHISWRKNIRQSQNWKKNK